MLRKKFYLPIGFLVLAILIGGFLFLHLQPPQEPVKIYKPVEPSTKGGHFHKDGTWHDKPHTEETAQGKPADPRQSRPMSIEKTVETYERLKKELSAAKRKGENLQAQRDTLQAKSEKLQSEIEALKAQKAVAEITNKGVEIIDTFPDVISMTPEKYLALSVTEQESFLQRAEAYDLAIREMYDFVFSSPQDVQDAIEDRAPEAMQRLRMSTSVSAADFYRGL